MYYVIVTFTAADGNAAITDDVNDMAAKLEFTLSLTAPVV